MDRSVLPPPTPVTLQNAVNALAAERGLPLMLTQAEPVPHGLSARFDSVRKAYLYRLYFPSTSTLARIRQPLLDHDSAWFVPMPLDPAAMEATAAHMSGKRLDCSLLRSRGCQALSPVKTLERVSVQVTPPEVWDGRGAFGQPLPLLGTEGGTQGTDAFRAHQAAAQGLTRVDITVTGPSFLYNMVRNIAGLLVWTGRGLVSPDAVARALAAGASRAAIPYKTAPPGGLTLLGVEYPPLQRLAAQVASDGAALCRQGGPMTPLPNSTSRHPPSSCPCGARAALASADASTPPEAVDNWVATIADSAQLQCCRSVALARRIREMSRRGTLNDGAWDDVGAQHGADPAWSARKALADERTSAILASTWGEGDDPDLLQR